MPQPSGDPSGDPSGNHEQELEQLRRQVTDLEATKKELDGLKAQIEKGELVSPVDALNAAYDAGTAYPKSRYAGLQRTIQEFQEKSTKAEESVADLKSQVATLNTEKASLQTEYDSLFKQNEGFNKQITELTARQERTKLIMSDYPELAPFEADGLIPNASADQLPDILKKMSERITAEHEKGKHEFAKGGGSPSPGGAGNTLKSAKELLIQSGEAKLKGDFALGDELYDQYLVALDKEK